MVRTAHGFTLLELMVVVALIGVILVLVMPSVGDGGRQERLLREVKRITALVELVGEESVIKSTMIGLRFGELGYGFVSYDGERWNEVEGDKLLKPHQFDELMELALVVDGYRVDLAQKLTEEEIEEKGVTPHLLFLPSGERTPFELTLRYRNEEAAYLLSVPPMGLAERRHLEAQ
ncbi:MAG: type II secretion system minor pseudopilin GspH [Chromatiales bacterium]|nr:type II secretion system minor pseudopilin GspH [Chromatiales bacterium]